MKTHYVLQKLIQGQQYVGDDWELDSDNTTCRNKLTSATTHAPGVLNLELDSLYKNMSKSATHIL